MSKAARSTLASGALKTRVAELTPKHTLEARLLEIIADLDAAQQAVAAAYAQMALDLIRREPVAKV